jgi:hypothetical protein
VQWDAELNQAEERSILVAHGMSVKKFEHFILASIQLRRRLEGNPAPGTLTVLGFYGDGKLLYKRAGRAYLIRLLRSEFG